MKKRGFIILAFLLSMMMVGCTASTKKFYKISEDLCNGDFSGDIESQIFNLSDESCYEKSLLIYYYNIGRLLLDTQEELGASGTKYVIDDLAKELARNLELMDKPERISPQLKDKAEQIVKIKNKTEKADSNYNACAYALVEAVGNIKKIPFVTTYVQISEMESAYESLKTVYEEYCECEVVGFDDPQEAVGDDISKAYKEVCKNSEEVLRIVKSMLEEYYAAGYGSDDKVMRTGLIPEMDKLNIDMAFTNINFKIQDVNNYVDDYGTYAGKKEKIKKIIEVINE